MANFYQPIARRIVIGFLSIEAYGFLRAFEKSYSLRISSPLIIPKIGHDLVK